MLCVYGIVRASHPGVDVIGIHDGTTSMVRHGELGAVVSEVEDELLARRRDVDAHLRVLEEAHATGDVLPLRFGTVVRDEAAMRRVLDEGSRRFLDLLDRVGGRVQMTIKAVRDDDAAVKVAVDTDPRLRRMVERRRSSSVWADRVALGQQVAGAVDELSAGDARRIVDALAPAAEAVSMESAAPPVIVSLALLMMPDRLTQLDTAVAELHDTLGERIRFDYAGPMPAYSFVT